MEITQEVTSFVVNGVITLVVLVFFLKLLSSNKDLHVKSNSFWLNGEIKITSRKDNPSKNRQYSQCPYCKQNIRTNRLENHKENKCVARKR